MLLERLACLGNCIVGTGSTVVLHFFQTCTVQTGFPPHVEDHATASWEGLFFSSSSGSPKPRTGQCTIVYVSDGLVNVA